MRGNMRYVICASFWYIIYEIDCASFWYIIYEIDWEILSDLKDFVN
jgi:hypothetical protein